MVSEVVAQVDSPAVAEVDSEAHLSAAVVDLLLSRRLVKSLGIR